MKVEIEKGKKHKKQKQKRITGVRQNGPAHTLARMRGVQRGGSSSGIMRDIVDYRCAPFSDRQCSGRSFLFHFSFLLLFFLV